MQNFRLSDCRKALRVGTPSAVVLKWGDFPADFGKMEKFTNKKIKKMKPLKLNKLSDRKLNEKQMNAIRGGAPHCTCGCQWAGNGGGSSVQDNCRANGAAGLHVPAGVDVACEYYKIKI